MPVVGAPRALALVVAGLLACGHKRTPPPPPPPADAAPGPVVHDLAAAPTAPAPPRPPMPQEIRFALLEPGAAPRVVRRYRPSATGERTFAITARITERRYHDGAWHDPIAHAPIRDGFAVMATAAPGGIALALRGLDGAVVTDQPTVAAAEAALLTRWRTLLERRRISVAIDDRGRLGRIEFVDDPSGQRPDAGLATDELVQRWLGLAVPWPEPAIGVGARWKVVTVLRVGGVYLKQTATYRLAAIDGDRVTVEVELVRLGEAQSLDLPGAPAELIALRRDVTGTITVGTTDPLPRAATLTSSQSSHAQVTLGPGPRVDEVSDDHATLEISDR